MGEGAGSTLVDKRKEVLGGDASETIADHPAETPILVTSGIRNSSSMGSLGHRRSYLRYVFRLGIRKRGEKKMTRDDLLRRKGIRERGEPSSLGTAVILAIALVLMIVTIVILFFPAWSNR